MKKEKDEKGKKSKKKKSRGIFGKIIVCLLSILAVLGLIAISMSVLCSYVNPTQFVWLSFFGLAFWAILFFNIVMLLLLLLMRSRNIWIAIVALLIATPGFFKSFSTGKQQNGGELRVMTYNMCMFRDMNDPEKQKKEVAEDEAKIIKENHPDVLCVQEFSKFTTKMGREEAVVEFGKMVDMPYHYYHTKANFRNNVIYSKYPLSALKEDIPFAAENDYGAVARVDAGEKGVFYVVCCHLTSFRLTKDEITMFSSESGNSKEQVEEYGKSIVVKLKDAFEKRSEEVARMLADIPHDGRPILLCGDFNDTPLSYTYQQIKKAGVVDGFVKAGHGIGHTYAGKLPLLRIDYVWVNEQIQPVSFHRLKQQGSDHYPVMLDFNVIHGL